MKPILALVRKDIKLFLNDRIAMTFTFAMPLVMIILFGFVFGGAGGGSGPITIIGIDHSNTGLSRKIMRSVDSTHELRVLHSFRSDEPPHAETPFNDSVANYWVRTGKVTAAFIIPADAITDTAMGLKLTLMYDARNQMETQILQGVLQQTIMTKTPGMFITLMKHAAENTIGKAVAGRFDSSIQSVVKQFFGSNAGKKSTSDSVAESDSIAAGSSQFFSNLIKIDQQQLVGATITNPMVTRSIGGWALMFALFSLTAASRSIIEEREEGTLHRLLSTPIPRTSILIAKFLYTWLLGIVQLTVLFILGSLIFSVNIFANFGNLILIVLLSSAAATSFGMLLAAFARTSAQANGISTICILSMSALGGSWFPVSLMPPFIQTMSKLTLTYWSVDAFLTVLYRNLGVSQLWPNILVLGGITVVLTGISLWRFGNRETW